MPHLVGVVGAVRPRIVDELGIPLRRGAVVIEAEALAQEAAHVRRIDTLLAKGHVHSSRLRKRALLDERGAH